MVADFVVYTHNMGVRFQGKLKRFYDTSFRSYLIESKYEIATINKKINNMQSFNEFLIKNKYTSQLSVRCQRQPWYMHMMRLEIYKTGRNTNIQQVNLSEFLQKQ